MESKTNTSDSLEGSVQEPAPPPTWTPAEERAVRHKLDLHIIPTITLMYLVTFIDRSNIGNARIQGMEHDLNLSGYRFNWALTSFYLAFAAIEVPSNLVIKRVGATFWLPCLVVSFGAVCIGTAFVRNYGQLVFVRGLLGAAEGRMLLGGSWYLSTLYKREELLFRVGFFVTAACLAGAFGGLLATGLTEIPRFGSDDQVLHTWRHIFFFEGLITLLIGMVSWKFLPRAPGKCQFLDPLERDIAVSRLKAEKSDVDERISMGHIKQGILNINTQFCAFGLLCVNVSLQSTAVFMPTILRDLGYKPIQAQLHTVPPYVVAGVVALLINYLSDRTKRRGIYVAPCGIIALVGYLILLVSTSSKAKYGAVFMVAIGAFPNAPAFLCWGINNSGSVAERAVASGVIMTISTLGALIATWTYVDKDKPLYHIGHSINLAFQALLVVLAIGCTVYCRYENKARDAGKRNHRLLGLSELGVSRLGSKHPQFRYME